MRVLVLIVGLLPCLPGCSVWHLAHRTMYSELSQYPLVTDGKLSNRQYLRWAKDEWQRVANSAEGAHLSSDYGSGFLQGFVDQVYAGGKVRIPAMPPRKYWRIGYRNERGQRAIDDWYEGFRHGASVAKEGGYRDQAVIPSSLWAHPNEGLDEYLPLNESDAESVSPGEIEYVEPSPAEALPTPAEPMPSATDLDLAPPPPTPPEGLSLDQIEDLPTVSGREIEDLPTVSGRELEARLLEIEATHFEQPLPSPGDETTAEEQSEDRQMVEEVAVAGDPEGPPAPPWRRTIASQMNRTQDTPSPKTDKASFDPFAGTPFRESLGLTSPHPSRATARGSGAEQPTASGANADPADEEPEDAAAETDTADDTDPADQGWQCTDVPPSTWKSRN